ncbi:hypothetical protein [Maribacter ulvicola]|uniref:Uncharacterized protein n=1 Tax=Maribacter ulvicola TaxID=228959 RepID=A0A1N7AQ62_9FLAO|nr:hypothetical protein [Maribacter ulvicola]SIR41260.1 hypothetical protein SAMN05421797_1143 [Maribacter ulvicola]
MKLTEEIKASINDDSALCWLVTSSLENTQYITKRAISLFAN